MALSTFTFLGTHHYHPSSELFLSCKAETLYLLSILFVHSSVDGHCFCPLAVVDGAAKNIGVHFKKQEYNSF